MIAGAIVQIREEIVSMETKQNVHDRCIHGVIIPNWLVPRIRCVHISPHSSQSGELRPSLLHPCVKRRASLANGHCFLVQLALPFHTRVKLGGSSSPDHIALYSGLHIFHIIHFLRKSGRPRWVRGYIKLWRLAKYIRDCVCMNLSVRLLQVWVDEQILWVAPYYVGC